MGLFRLSFITLTIQAGDYTLEAKEGHRLLLTKFLQWMRRREGVKSYIWKAEFQKNGQLHYHITTNRYIRYERIRNEWNRILKEANLLDEFQAKYGHYNANSTDIHSVKKIRNLGAYIAKYISKSIGKEGGTEGKVWDCSRNLKEAKYYTLEISDELHSRIMWNDREGKLDLKIEDNYSILSEGKGRIKDLMNEKEWKDYREHLYKIDYTAWES